MKKILLILVFLILVVGCQNQQQLQEVENLKVQLTEKEEQIKELNKENEILDKKIETSNKFNEYYNKAIENYYFAIGEGLTATYNYNSFSFNWDNGFLEAAIDTCEVAREYYSSSNQRYQTAISNFEEAKKYSDKEIIDYYIKASDIAIDIQWAMYEACEYFESSASWYMQEFDEKGNIELEKANEKIKEHDNMIKEYNRYLSKIEVLLE